MSKFNKQFEHKDYKFNISVELNTKAERTLNGKVWHTVITNCLGSNNYYIKDEVLSVELENCINKHKEDAINYIDKLTYKPKSFEEMLLSNMGFL